MSQEVYPKAPITEASFDVRVRVPAATSMTSLASITDPFYGSLFQRPTKMEIKIEANQADASSTAEASNTPLGFSYRSNDGRKVFQVRSDGFTHNQLAPYTNWLDFSSEAKRLWSLYKSGAAPEAIELIGLTYVNELQVPNQTRFEDYFSIYLHVPESLPQGLKNFNFGLQVTDEENDCFVFVGQRYGIPKDMEHAPIILNIQAFKELNKSVSDISDEDLWRMFEQLRAAKNKFFEGTITEKVREMLRWQ